MLRDKSVVLPMMDIGFGICILINYRGQLLTKVFGGKPVFTWNVSQVPIPDLRLNQGKWSIPLY